MIRHVVNEFANRDAGLVTQERLDFFKEIFRLDLGVAEHCIEKIENRRTRAGNPNKLNRRIKPLGQLQKSC